MFSKKRIKVEISLLSESFVPQATLEFEDMPIDAQISYVGFPSAPKAKIKIYGVSKERMDEITTIQLFTPFIQNRRLKLFIDEGNGYQVLFDGGIVNAFPQYNSAPDVYIQIESSALWYQNFENLPPFESSGAMSVFDVVNGICKQFGLKAENCLKNNIPAKHSTYNQNGARERLYAVEKEYGIKLIFLTNNTVRVFDKENAKIYSNYELTPDDYVGYPSFNNSGVEVTLDRMIDIECWDTFTIADSYVGFANTTWRCYKKTYNVQSYANNPRWEMKILGVYNVIEE